MLKKETIQQWFKGLLVKLNVTVADDRQAEIDTAIDEFIRANPGTDPANQDTMTALADVLKGVLQPQQQNTQQNQQQLTQPPAQPDMQVLMKGISDAITAAVTPIAQKLDGFEKQFGESQKGVREQQIETTLQNAYSLGKFTSAQYGFYKQQLEGSFDSTKAILENMAPNAVLAKENKKATPVVPPAQQQQNTQQNQQQNTQQNQQQNTQQNQQQHWDTKIARGVKSELLGYVSDNAQN